VVAGFRYDEIAAMTGARTFSTVRRYVGKSRARVRLARSGSEAPTRAGTVVGTV
jgi:hypothetical protein